jgi:hypothetical protein
LSDPDLNILFKLFAPRDTRNASVRNLTQGLNEFPAYPAIRKRACDADAIMRLHHKIPWQHI